MQCTQNWQKSCIFTHFILFLKYHLHFQRKEGTFGDQKSWDSGFFYPKTLQNKSRGKWNEMACNWWTVLDFIGGCRHPGACMATNFKIPWQKLQCLSDLKFKTTLKITKKTKQKTKLIHALSAECTQSMHSSSRRTVQWFNLNVSKVSQMGHSVKASLWWCVTLFNNQY